jgi:hypothetical protein
LLHVHGLRRATYVRNLDSDQGCSFRLKAVRLRHSDKSV